MNATCMIAATFITVTGVTERELPRDICPSGILYIKIPGLCLGAAQDLRHDAVVYVAFYRTERFEVSQSTAEQRKVSFYREHILKLFASKVREDLYGWVKVTPIHDELTTACWVDGASVQLGFIVSKNQQLQDEIDKIISNKHSAAGTAFEQPCNLSPCFMNLRKLSNTTTRSKPHPLVYKKRSRINSQRSKKK